MNGKQSQFAGDVSAVATIGFLLATNYVRQMTTDHYLVFLGLFGCMLLVLWALWQRLQAAGLMWGGVIGFGIGALGSIIGVSMALILLTIGPGSNGAAAIGIMIGFLATLCGLGIMGINAVLRPQLGWLRFAPLLAIPLLLSQFATMDLAVTNLELSETVSRIQTLLYVLIVGGTGLMLRQKPSEKRVREAEVR